MSEVTCPKCGEKFQPYTKGMRFYPPTTAEVATHIAEKGYTFSAEAFMAYYESKGWTVGKVPMKSWRAACVTWQEREDERHPDNAYASAKKAKSLKKHLAAAGYQVPAPEWVTDLHRRMESRLPWSRDEFTALKLWEAGKDVKPPKRPTSWSEVDNGS